MPRAKFPVIDVHVHPRVRFHHSPELLDEFVRIMDEQNIAVCVSLDGGLGESFAEHAKYLWTKYPDRFLIFANIDWRGSGREDEPATWDCQRPDFGRRMALALADAKRRGASGLKIFKQFGLGYRNPDGSLVKIDDPRWDPIWTACGELGLPVIMHTGDPAAFFRPIDERNERWEELRRHPDWSFYGPQWPQRDELLAARNRVIARHPKTTFIGAHVANDSEDLAAVGEWLDRVPEPGRRDRVADRRAGTTAVHGAAVLPAVTRTASCSAPTARAMREPTAAALAIPGDLRRVFSLRRESLSAAGPVEHLRPGAARRRAEKGLQRERRADHPRREGETGGGEEEE